MSKSRSPLAVVHAHNCSGNVFLRKSLVQACAKSPGPSVNAIVDQLEQGKHAANKTLHHSASPSQAQIRESLLDNFSSSEKSKQATEAFRISGTRRNTLPATKTTSVDSMAGHWKLTGKMAAESAAFSRRFDSPPGELKILTIGEAVALRENIDHPCNSKGSTSLSYLLRSVLRSHQCATSAT